MSKQLSDEKTFELIDQMVLVFPMYNHSYPLIVKEFLINLSERISISQIHISAVCTYGNDLGITLIQLDKLLRELGACLSLGYGIKMPYNYVQPTGFRMRGFLDSFKTKEYSDLEIQESNEQAQRRVRELVPLIRDKGFSEPEANSVFIESLVDRLGLQNTVQKKVWAKVAGTYTTKDESFYDMVKHMDDGFSVNEKCFACVAWCPEQAIDFRSSTVERRRYHNTEISISDMVVVESCSKYHVNLVP